MHTQLVQAARAVEERLCRRVLEVELIGDLDSRHRTKPTEP